MRKLLIIIALIGAMASFAGTENKEERIEKKEERIENREERSENLALRQLIERAERGDAKALYVLGTLHDTGYDTFRIDSVRSTALYRLAAEGGYAPAQNYLGYRYFNGEAVRQDVDSALYWMAKAAGGGDIKAANNLGFLLANSEVVTRDYPQAMMWLRKAADAGLPSAQANLADLYRIGLGTEPDTVTAEILYNKAIEGGLTDAGLKLLAMKGKEWEQLPADSAVKLGRGYYAGMAPFIGVTLFENAAAEGDTEALALLGDAYSRAVGVEYNHERSLRYFLQAALAGQPSAQFVVGELLEIFPDALSEAYTEEILNEKYGNDIPEDVYSPAYWYEEAAAEGVTDAEQATERLLGY